jgi:lipoate-protein ligase A
MQTWRLIISGPGTGPENMAIDEALFLKCHEGKRLPALRLYTWAAPWMTIGYFQRTGDFAGEHLPITRRLTGGLSVAHGRDISYALVVTEEHWPALYDQSLTYRKMHTAFAEGLRVLGIAPEFSRSDGIHGAGGGVCVDTLFDYDLQLDGRKILGSCQRRRGKTLLQQGALHLAGLLNDYAGTCSALKAGIENSLGVTLVPTALSPDEVSLSRRIQADTYSQETWNSKF